MVPSSPGEWVVFEGATPVPSGDRPRVIFPGSFNPLHVGHTTLAAAATARLGEAVAFEISVANVDKPDLDPAEVRRRVDQFHGLGPVYVTRAATFVEKARLFPGAVFVVGADTAARIVQPRYYGHDAAAMIGALDSIRAVGCRFLVGGRLNDRDQFVEAGFLALPVEFADLFEGLAEGEFRVDVSSTQLRATHG